MLWINQEVQPSPSPSTYAVYPWSVHCKCALIFNSDRSLTTFTLGMRSDRFSDRINIKYQSLSIIYLSRGFNTWPPFIFLFLGTTKSSPNSFVYFICWMPLPVSFFSWQVTNSMNSFLSLKDTRIHGNVWCIVFSIVIIKWMLFAKNCFVFYSGIVRIEFGIWMVICVRTQY